MSQKFEVIYYANDKFGSMRERRRYYPATLDERIVRSQMDRWLLAQRQKGIPLFPQYDIQKVAA